jgi:hypothetical protein
VANQTSGPCTKLPSFDSANPVSRFKRPEKTFKSGFASYFSLDTFAVLIFEGFK